ncbi:sulfotransferase domain protein [Trichinella nativa]|uniref:Sulfotransferase domain protein n=1 Tax=Trichinella nativa TaxID=6335 RepID=A0A1Y3EK81_9BILA|nr:sulfotransferase domain protein [Trichinella nativa]
MDLNGNLEVDSEITKAYFFRIPRAFAFAGYIWPGVVVSPEQILTLREFHFRPTDILIISYPKSGTTWVSELLSQLCHSEQVKQKPLHERVPWLEMDNKYAWVRAFWLWQMFSKLFNSFTNPITPIALNEENNNPRIWFTHLPLELLPTEAVHGKCRIIYVYRNPKDTAVSYYHFHRMARFLGQQDFSWEHFFTLYISGKVYCGSWFEHLKSYWRLGQINQNMLFVNYEEMKKNLTFQIQRICKFLQLNLSAEIVQKTMDKVHFQNMKTSNRSNRKGVWLFNQKISEFIRKGQVGDWKNYFTVSQNEIFDQIYEIQMKATDLNIQFEM